MRISNPKLFNGQTLATKQQISGGLITIPSASILGLSELAAAVSTNAANISTISGALGTRGESLSGTAWGNISDIWGKLSELTGQDMTGGGLNLGSLDLRLTNVQTNLTTVSGDLDTLETKVDGLSDWKNGFVDQTAAVEGTGLAEVITGAVVNGVQTFTVNVPSAASFANHTIELAKLEQAETGYASSYQLMVDGAKQGDIINIPKDQFLKGAEIVEGTYADGVFTASEDGNKYIHFTFEIKVKDVDTLV